MPDPKGALPARNDYARLAAPTQGNIDGDDDDLPPLPPVPSAAAVSGPGTAAVAGGDEEDLPPLPSLPMQKPTAPPPLDIASMQQFATDRERQLAQADEAATRERVASMNFNFSWG
jgi:hypothetical protein